MKWSLKPCQRYETEISLLALEAGEPRPATRDRAAAAQAHLENCPDCRARLDELCALTRSLKKLEKLPEVAPPEGFQMRWTSAIRQNAEPPPARARVLSSLERLLFGPRAAWGALAGIWLLVTVFRLTAPAAPRPGAVARPSLQEIVQTIKTELLADSEAGQRAEAPHAKRPQDAPRMAPPRSERKTERVSV